MQRSFYSSALVNLSVVSLVLICAPQALAQYAPPEGMPNGFSGGIPAGMMGPPANIPDMGAIPSGQPANIPQGPSADQIEMMQKKGLEQQLKGMQQAAGGMEQALKQFERRYADMEKKGIVIGQTTKDSLDEIRGQINTIRAAKSPDELQDIDQDAIAQKLQALGEDVGKYQKMAGLKKMLASMERGVVSYEKQLKKLKGQGVVIPTEIKDDLAKLKTGLEEIKNAKTPEDMDKADPEQLGDLMTKVNETRPQLEMFAKWPRVLRQADQQLAQFQKQLVKTKVLVERLAKNEIDVSVDFQAFQKDIADLQAARDEANSLMKEGKGEEAFNKLEDDFFNKLDDVGEHQRVIQQMSNLSRFAFEFKKGMATAKKTLDQLKRAKKDTTALQDIFDQALAKGNAIVALIKVKPLDEDGVLAAMDEMENLKQQFQNTADELSGGQAMPWETKSPNQFEGLALPKDFSKFIP